MLIMVFSVWLGWLPPTGRGETVSVLGVEVSFLTADGVRHLFISRSSSSRCSFA
jgi:peptide/nickel transport system permease protein